VHEYERINDPARKTLLEALRASCEDYQMQKLERDFVDNNDIHKIEKMAPEAVAHKMVCLVSVYVSSRTHDYLYILRSIDII
jgi:hypothetical protein